MNKLLNDALRAKGYKGPDIKMGLTNKIQTDINLIISDIMRITTI